MNVKDCHEEKIHIPGAIQSFGYLIGLDSASKKITIFSENLSDIFPVDNLKSLLGRHLEDFPEVFMPVIWAEAYKDMDCEAPQNCDSHISTLTMPAGKFYMTVTHASRIIYLEFEKILRKPDSRDVVRQFSCMLDAADPSEIWTALLGSIENIIGYDRLIVYRFMEDGSGKAIAEHRQDGVESLLGLSFPEFDIPKQAREFYLINKKRLFSNVFQAPIPIISNSAEPADLTFVQSRAMSPIHGQYVKNMGFCSSFSTSIVIEGKLWGLVTCHNVVPKHIDLMDRQQAEVLTTLAAYAYSSYESNKNLQDKINLSDSFNNLKISLANHTSLRDALSATLSDIMSIVAADGVVAGINGEIFTLGAVPSAHIIENLLEWSKAEEFEFPFADDSFNKNVPENLRMDNSCAGMMMIGIEKPIGITLIWFRKEYTRQIKWAGLPEKISVTRKNDDDEEEMIFKPRENFSAYQEEFSGRSYPWTTLDKSAASQIRTQLMQMSIDDYFKIQRLTAEIDEVNEELTNFSHTVSHDLNTPLTVMRLNAQMMLKNATPENKTRAEHIIQQIDEMAAMMSSVMQHSKTKNYEITLENVALGHLIQKIAEDTKMTYQTPDTEVIIGDCPQILGDATLAYQIFLNLISNAVKYSSKSQSPRVEVFGMMDGESVIYTIKDNGIGISEDDADKIFKPYFRTQGAADYKGVGVGMSIVKRIMDKIGGTVSFESKVGEGSTFKLTFKKPS